MQFTRFLASNMLRQQQMQLARSSGVLRTQSARRMFQTSSKRMAVPKEEHAAHTISQRIRTLKKIPPELIPLGVVLFAAIAAAGYSIIRKFYTDRTLRLYRQGPQKDH
ncbi:Hypothetical protein R9X50_00627200 [Acrodontium crateriforme]|uniref:Uncharacterized protein n=1 Tax=Acrodontium crateriforme TaxID=150365 RepID=A0AAQ3M9Q8_9PEZI|nr:Hypothetical protein R9X50_00627200 [Acrodontium crateriforme]